MASEHPQKHSSEANSTKPEQQARDTQDLASRLIDLAKELATTPESSPIPPKPTTPVQVESELPTPLSVRDWHSNLYCCGGQRTKTIGPGRTVDGSPTTLSQRCHDHYHGDSNEAETCGGHAPNDLNNLVVVIDGWHEGCDKDPNSTLCLGDLTPALVRKAVTRSRDKRLQYDYGSLVMKELVLVVNKSKKFGILRLRRIWQWIQNTFLRTKHS